MNKENSILFLGDVAPYRPYRFTDDCKTVINLECPLTNSGIPATNKIILGANGNYLKSIFNSRLFCVNLGNNHILDYGKNGLDYTVNELEKAGISYFGLNNKNDNNPMITEFNKIKIAFISAVCETTSPVLEHDKINYISVLDTDDIIRKIKSVRKLADRVVVYVHWGEEDSSYPVRKDITIARRLIDEGTDIVIGCHAHAPQAIEKYKEGIIAYSLGNFIMPELKNIPSYYDEKGISRSFFSSRMMLWNRISWGLMINMATMEYSIRRFIFNRSRVIELPVSPLDRFLKLPDFQDDSYELKIKNHKRRRKLQRKITDFIFHPRIPQKFKKKKAMKVGLLLNCNNKLTAFSEKYKTLLTINDIPHVLIDPNSKTLPDDLKACSHLLFNHSQGDTDLKIYDTIFNIANKIFGIKCLPDFDSYWQYEDKIKEYYMLKCNGFPIIDSNVFWNIEHADAFLEKAQYPIVAKLPKGAKSSNVVLVRSREEGKSINRQVFIKGVKSGKLNSPSNLATLRNAYRNAGLFKYSKSSLRSFLIDRGIIRDKSYFPEWQIQKDAILYQKYLPNNSFDSRIVVIGDRAFGSRRFVRKNDFRASGSGIADMDSRNVDLRCVKIAFSISSKLKYGTMGYDFIYDENNEPYINELGYCFPDHIIHDLTGYWDRSMVWHEAKDWPQVYQLNDFLQTELKNSIN